MTNNTELKLKAEIDAIVIPLSDESTSLRKLRLSALSGYELSIKELREKDKEIEALKKEVELLNGSIQQLLFDISKGRL